MTEAAASRYIAVLFGVIISLGLCYGSALTQLFTPPKVETDLEIQVFVGAETADSVAELVDSGATNWIETLYIVLVITTILTSFRTTFSQAILTVHRPTIFLCANVPRFRVPMILLFSLIFLNYYVFTIAVLILFKNGWWLSAFLFVPYLLGPILFSIQSSLYRKYLAQLIVTNSERKVELKEFETLLSSYAWLNQWQVVIGAVAALIVVSFLLGLPPTARMYGYDIMLAVLIIGMLVSFGCEWYNSREWYVSIVDWFDEPVCRFEHPATGLSDTQRAPGRDHE